MFILPFHKEICILIYLQSYLSFRRIPPVTEFTAWFHASASLSVLWKEKIWGIKSRSFLPNQSHMGYWNGGYGKNKSDFIISQSIPHLCHCWKLVLNHMVALWIQFLRKECQVGSINNQPGAGGTLAEGSSLLDVPSKLQSRLPDKERATEFQTADTC